MKKILFVLAMNLELNSVKQEIKKINISKFLEISFLKSWMWNYNTIFNLTKFLEKNNDIDFIINIWVCWFKKYRENFIQIWRIKNILNNKELIIPNFINFWKIDSIACSEDIIYNSDEIWQENFIDMESFWFEMVSEKYNIPRIILKIPVDKIWDETRNFDFKKAKRFLVGNIDYEKLVENISDFLDKNKKEEINLDKYYKKFNFSESQKVIFEKLYNKYLVLVWNDFDKYFNKFLEKSINKKIEKKDLKEFLKTLEIYLDDK